MLLGRHRYGGDRPSVALQLTASQGAVANGFDAIAALLRARGAK